MPRIRSLRGKVYTEAERADLIGRFLGGRLRAESGDATMVATQTAIVREYEAATPIVSVSRSPIDGDVFETSLDTFGLDGMWWAYEYDYRPFVEATATTFAWTGSMQLEGSIDGVRLKTMIGPQVPFVLPRILSHPGMTAVVSSVLIGEHVGYPVVYFIDGPLPRDLERVNDWGHDHYLGVRSDGSPMTARSTEYDLDKDFDLEPWIGNGRLRWIEPGDIDLTLRDRPDGCPFLGLVGARQRQYIQNGRVWLAADRDFGVG